MHRSLIVVLLCALGCLTGPTKTTVPEAGGLFDVSGETIASVGSDGALRLWDATSRQPRVLSMRTKEIKHMRLDPIGSRLAYINSRELVIMDIVTGREIVAKDCPFVLATAIAWSPGGRFLAVSGQALGRELSRSQIFVYSVGDRVSLVSVHDLIGLEVYDFMFLTETTLLLKGFTIIDVLNGKRQTYLQHGPSFSAFVLEPDRDAVVAAGAGAGLWKFQIGDWKATQLSVEDRDFSMIALSPSGQFLATLERCWLRGCSSARVRIFTTMGKELCGFDTFKNVRRLAFHPKENVLFVQGYTLEVWDIGNCLP